MKRFHVIRKGLTFSFLIWDKNGDNLRTYYIQFSTKDPWYYPKKELVCDGKVMLWGWLYFFVGCDPAILK